MAPKEKELQGQGKSTQSLGRRPTWVPHFLQKSLQLPGLILFHFLKLSSESTPLEQMLITFPPQTLKNKRAVVESLETMQVPMVEWYLDEQFSDPTPSSLVDVGKPGRVSGDLHSNRTLAESKTTPPVHYSSAKLSMCSFLLHRNI